jgi:hypothetical protein
VVCIEANKAVDHGKDDKGCFSCGPGTDGPAFLSAQDGLLKNAYKAIVNVFEMSSANRIRLSQLIRVMAMEKKKTILVWNLFLVNQNVKRKAPAS